jgi:cation diffusion facilitator family transporter
MAFGGHTIRFMAKAELERGSQVRRVLLLTLGLNVVVAGAKVAYGFAADSLSIRADGFHSLTDASNNLVGVVGAYFGSRPADEGHPYGHEKLEILAAGVVGLSLLGMAYEVLNGALTRLRFPEQAPSLDALAFVVLGLTLFVNLFVASYERRMGERLKSPFLISDALHTRSDVLVTLGVLITTILVKLGYPGLDTFAALVIAGFIAWAGVGVLRTNLGYLADARAVDTTVVERVVLSVPGVASTHKIRTRGSPGAIHIDLHVQIARHLNTVEGHAVAHWVSDAIKGAVPGVRDVLVHTEPAAPGQPFNPIPAGELRRG